MKTALLSIHGIHEKQVLVRLVVVSFCILFSIVRLFIIFILLAQVVQKVDSAIHWINHYPVDNTKNIVNTYPLDSDLSGG